MTSITADMQDIAGVTRPMTAEEAAAADARARADYAAGRHYDHAVVSRWLRTWGTADFKPFFEWLNTAKTAER